MISSIIIKTFLGYNLYFYRLQRSAFGNELKMLPKGIFNNLKDLKEL